jgi:hypothetical protein
MGLPIMMLPNLSKDYGSISVITELWNEFRSVLRRARSVFVLGHSLNDDQLCTALGQDVGDGRRIAIAQVTPNSDGPLRDRDELDLATNLGVEYTPTIVPINFGHPIQEVTTKALAEWQRRMNTL